MKKLFTFICLLLSFSSFAEGPVLEALGEVDGIIHIVNMPRDQIQAMLPKGIELPKKEKGDDTTTHPVIFLIGDQSNVHFKVDAKATTLPGAMGKIYNDKIKGEHHLPGVIEKEYKEMVMLIPDLESKEYPGMRFAHSPSMYVNGTLAKLAGEFYNFPKKVFEFTGDSVESITIQKDGFISKTSVISFNSTATRQKITPDELKASQKKIERLFRQPMLQPGAIDLCSYFDWQLDTAKITPALGSVAIESEFFEDFEDNFKRQSKKIPEPATYVQKPLGKADHGAFKIKGGWSLTLGLPCKHFQDGNNTLLKKWFLDLENLDRTPIEYLPANSSCHLPK
jgi:hypothetical protein